MLTGTADGYIGARPQDRSNNWTDYSANNPWEWQWMAYNQAHPGPNGETGGAGAQAGAGATTAPGAAQGAGVGDGTSTGASGVTTGASTPEAGSTLDAATRARLLQLMTMDPYATSIDDPSLRPSATAFERARERQLTKQREANAEKMAAQGLGSSGALDTANSSAWESAGQDIAQNQSDLVLNQIKQKREDVNNALALGKDVLTADQDAQLRLQLANIDAALRQRALDLQAQSIGNQNQQFNDSLGFDIGKWESQLNSSAGV